MDPSPLRKCHLPPYILNLTLFLTPPPFLDNVTNFTVLSYWSRSSVNIVATPTPFFLHTNLLPNLFKFLPKFCSFSSPNENRRWFVNRSCFHLCSLSLSRLFFLCYHLLPHWFEIVVVTRKGKWRGPSKTTRIWKDRSNNFCTITLGLICEQMIFLNSLRFSCRVISHK